MTTFFLGLPRIAPIDLSVIGIGGCGFWVYSAADASVPTAGGDPFRGEGTAVLTLPVPGIPGLRGVTLGAQAAIYDPLNGRALPLTITNGLLITLQ